MTLFELLMFVALAPFVLSATYLALLALLALLPDRPIEMTEADLRRFGVVIPAHNEECRIVSLLSSLREASYPPALVRILVVADNCDDETAAAARSAGALVCIRRDALQLGKGHALSFGLAQIGNDLDALVFLDADCVVSPNLFSVFNQRLAQGESVIQAYYTMRAPSSSGRNALRELALVLVHRLRPLAKRHFGGSAGLKGSGMCFSRNALERCRWTSTGLAEDTEQHARLLQTGLRVTFAPEVTVTGEAPATLSDAWGQHSRWEAGRVAVARRYGPGLLFGGISRGSVAMIDAGIELLIPPVSIVMLGLGAAAIIGALMQSTVVAGAAFGGLALLGAYLAVGIILAAARPADVVRAVVALPRYITWKAALYAQAIVASPETWERTRRDG